MKSVKRIDNLYQCMCQVRKGSKIKEKYNNKIKDSKKITTDLNFHLWENSYLFIDLNEIVWTFVW